MVSTPRNPVDPTYLLESFQTVVYNTASIVHSTLKLLNGEDALANLASTNYFHNLYRPGQCVLRYRRYPTLETPAAANCHLLEHIS